MQNIYFKVKNTDHEKKENIGDFFNRKYTIKSPSNIRSYEVNSSSSDYSNKDSENNSYSNSDTYSSYTQSGDSNSFSSEHSNKKKKLMKLKMIVFLKIF